MPEQWKKTFLAAAARAEVDAYFTHCVGLLEAGELDEAEHKLSRSRWRAKVELSAVPDAIVNATDSIRLPYLTSSANGRTTNIAASAMTRWATENRVRPS